MGDLTSGMRRAVYKKLTTPTLRYRVDQGPPFGVPIANVLPYPPRYNSVDRAPNPLVMYAVAGSGTSLPGSRDRVCSVRIWAETTSGDITVALAEAIRERVLQESDPDLSSYPAWAFAEGIVVVSVSEPIISEVAFDLYAQRFFSLLTFVAICVQPGCPTVAPGFLTPSALGV